MEGGSRGREGERGGKERNGEGGRVKGGRVKGGRERVKNGRMEKEGQKAGKQLQSLMVTRLCWY